MRPMRAPRRVLKLFRMSSGRCCVGLPWPCARHGETDTRGRGEKRGACEGVSAFGDGRATGVGEGEREGRERGLGFLALVRALTRSEGPLASEPWLAHAAEGSR